MHNIGQYIFQSREVKVGELSMGGNNPVLIQTMTNTSLSDIKATTDQIERVVNLGCDIVRIAVPTLKDISCIEDVKKELKRRYINVPLVADIHYSPAIAEMSARIVEKVRINPGNFIKDVLKKRYTQKDFELSKEQIFENAQPLLKVCKQYGTALRIGVNWGSLSKRILYRYGNTPLGMVESAMEFMNILLDSGFNNFTLSLKASDVKIMQEANTLLVKRMIKKNIYFPIHLGVTEAGSDVAARVKSAVGIGGLLKLGIGDTIRVSLTEDPENEIPVAKKIARFSKKNRTVNILELRDLHFKPKPINEKIRSQTENVNAMIVGNTDLSGADIVKKDKSFFLKNNNIKIDLNDIYLDEIKSEKSYFDFFIESSIRFSYDFLSKGVNTIFLENKNISNKQLISLSQEILQALGLRYSKPEYIACPSCGRTRFVIIEQLKKVQEKTSHLKGVKIAVMGCQINGPGEMTDADYGYVGTGKGKVTIYEKGKAVMKNVSEDEAPDILVKIIEKDKH